uniref:Uncharacterized protein n=1 Tax=Anopheles coluzzii TaxID=1518534 RepID=A0A8W7PRW7_ANOCL
MFLTRPQQQQQHQNCLHDLHQDDEPAPKLKFWLHVADELFISTNGDSFATVRSVVNVCQHHFVAMLFPIIIIIIIIHIIIIVIIGFSRVRSQKGNVQQSIE